MQKRATTRYPIHDLLAQRWSPRVFSDRALESEQLGSLIEAARWSPSSYNEQPWRFVVALRQDAQAFERLKSCLVPANAAWAGSAAALALSVARLDFERNGKPNRHALHDVGLAAANLTVQAESMGISVHQMAGFDAERARSELALPQGCEPVAMLAIGYRGAVDGLPEELRAREEEPRTRRPLGELAFRGLWGAPFFEDGA